MTTIRPTAAPIRRANVRAVAPAASAQAAKPTQAVAPAKPIAPAGVAKAINTQGAVETSAKIIGGIAGAAAGVGGGAAIGLVGHFILGAMGNPLASAVLPICGLGFGALGAWAGWKNGQGLGQLVEGFFK
jgi:hypothetical protein